MNGNGKKTNQKTKFYAPKKKRRTDSKKILSAQRNTRTKETKAKKKSSVPIAGRDFTLNMPALRKILMR